MTMPPLIVVTGPPGAGKSSVSAILSADFPLSALVRGDSFYSFIDQGFVLPWLPESHGQNVVVSDAAAAATGRLVKGGYTVVYDGVVGPWLIREFASVADVTNLHYVILMPSEDECARRVRTRIGHGFTDERVTRQLHRQFATAEIDPRHVVAGDQQTPPVIAEIRRRFQGGDLLLGTGPC